MKTNNRPFCQTEQYQSSFLKFLRASIMLFLQPDRVMSEKYKYSALLKMRCLGPYSDKRELQLCIDHISVSHLERFVHTKVDVYIKELLRVQKMK